MKSKSLARILGGSIVISVLATVLLSACNDLNIVMTDAGIIRGIETPSSRQFLGIPYAAPPTGPLRWQPPQAAPSWHGVRDAQTFASHCAQSASPFGVASTSEDCLYLNVYIPKGVGQGNGQGVGQGNGQGVGQGNGHGVGQGNGNFPVMVWIHGGGFIAGESNDYDPAKFVEQGIAVVTINYRLGALGFLAHPALTAESPDHASGNYALMDQQAALKWVKNNIASFGGDSSNITVFGESAGGLSIYSQLASPLAAGLFNKAIIQSGAYSLLQPTLPMAESLGQSFATHAGCPDQSITCLRNLPVFQVLASESKIQVRGTTMPTVDGKVLTQTIASALGTGNFNKVPVITGGNANEYSWFSAATIDPLLGHPITTATEYAMFKGPLAAAAGKTPAQIDAIYPPSSFANLAEAYDTVATDFIFSCNVRTTAKLLSGAVPVFAYEFNDPNAPMVFQLPPRPRFGAYHAAELQYLFTGYKQIVVGAPFTAAQQALSSEMIGYWTQFAKTGNPNATGSAWPQYTSANDTYMSLQPGASTPTTQFAANHNCAFWTGI